jgi:hypothetical protein
MKIFTPEARNHIIEWIAQMYAENEDLIEHLTEHHIGGVKGLKNLTDADILEELCNIGIAPSNWENVPQDIGVKNQIPELFDLIDNAVDLITKARNLCASHLPAEKPSSSGSSASSPGSSTES